MTDEGVRYLMHLRQGELEYLTGTGIADMVMFLGTAHKNMSSNDLSQAIGNFLEIVNKKFPNTKEEAMRILSEHFS